MLTRERSAPANLFESGPQRWLGRRDEERSGPREEARDFVEHQLYTSASDFCRGAQRARVLDPLLSQLIIVTMLFSSFMRFQRWSRIVWPISSSGEICVR